MTKVKLMMVGIALIACSTKSASEYPTSEMTADLTAIATGNGATTVNATLREPGTLLTFLQLTADDKFIASQGAETKSMGETSLFGMVSYSAAFNKDAADTEFGVKLTRTLDSGAPSSSARLPMPFTLGTLAKNEFSRLETILVSWTSDPSADPMSLVVSGECIAGVTATPGASATSYTIDANTLKKRTPSDADDKVADTCDVTITLSRKRSGTVDKAFHSGSFTASQERRVSFKTKP
ncbi:MAG TPA: hypothetical protein VGK67_03055 [Myxococcales bacterium]|jgi:hypothetical protein